jgi:nucleoside-diphosphate-sugar epimerase
MKVLVTGANGFIGRFLCSKLRADGYDVRGSVLTSEKSVSLIEGVEPVIVESLDSRTDWIEALADIDTVIHLAARVHIMNDSSKSPLEVFRRVNVDGTLQLAKEAARLCVKRLVFVSSIKVNGEETDIPYSSKSCSNPGDPYGVSKWEAEQGLRNIEAETGLEVVIVRPVMVYGPGVKANFLKMMVVIQKQIPLPFASVKNLRSMIYVENLVDALVLCVNHSSAKGKTYLLSDGEDISIPELIRRTASALGVRAFLFPFPGFLLRLVGIVTGNCAAVNRLIKSLSVDNSEITRELGWRPPFSMNEGLIKTARWYKSQM